jgi:hypothetical protein
MNLVKWIIKASVDPKDPTPIGTILPLMGGSITGTVPYIEPRVVNFMRLLVNSRSISEEVYCNLYPDMPLIKSGYLECDGSLVNPLLFPELAEYLDNIPDLRGRIK